MASDELMEEQIDSEVPVEEDGIDAADIDESFVARPRENIASVELDGESVLLVEGTTRPHWLNQIGTVVWNCLDGSVSLGDLSGELAEAFGADREVVEQDVINLAQEIGRAGLLVGVKEELPSDGSPYAPPEGLELGSEAPNFEAQDSAGKAVTLEDFRGRKLLLVNWSPYCGFCKKIVPDLGELQPDLQAQGVELVLLSIGEAEDNAEVLAEGGLDATLLLQDGSAEIFLGLGTPTGYLLDEDGKTASELTIGAVELPVLARSAAGREDSGEE